jgi:hypothetical protein
MRAITALTTILALATATFAQNICSQFQPVPGRCDLNATPVAQAKCLLRPVKKFGNLGNPLTSLPAPLDTLIGQTTAASFTLDQVRRFLVTKTIAEADLGGSLSVPLTAPKYFVIHDTSDFSEAAEFASNINSETASINRLTSRVTHKVAHVYVNRIGASGTAVVFESQDPPSGTKFGRCNSSKRRQFLHIENIQPRIRDRSVSFDNDAIAPTPGFTDAQLERLALLYIVASARSGKWLIPAYHSPIDLGFKNAHDDPQNFDLEKWAAKLTELIAQVHAM